jgi:hypothetical protein
MLVRYCLLAFSAATALLGAWTLATEWIQPSGSSGSAVSEEAAPTSAWTILPRGEVWAAAASAKAGLLSATPLGQRIEKSRTAELRDLSERAVLLAPHDARMWLMLAEIEWRNGEMADKISRPLKMSYYTGPHELALFPRRQLVAAASAAFTDDELKDLIRDDLRAAARQSEMRPAIEAAYRAGPPQAKEFILASLDQFAPDFRGYLEKLK